MRGPSSREIQVFVAGALALDGLHTIIAWLRGSIPMSDRGALVAQAIATLALPLGIAILLKSAFALRAAYVYLGLVVVLGCVAVVAGLSIIGTGLFQYPWVRRFTISLATALVLLLVLLWSAARHPRDENAV